MAEQNPLETFVLKYVETVGGLWQPVEPQVYDALLPPEIEPQLDLPPGDESVRLAFDPEALGDFPQAHLMVYGNPTLDRLFQHAQSLGQVGQVYITGLNLSPHDLPAILKRNLTLVDGLSLQMISARVSHYRSVLFWFQTTFVSDEKEQVTHCIGIDMHHGRPARHLLQLLQEATISETRQVAYPDATTIGLAPAYALAREEAIRAITVDAHTRLADLQRHLLHEIQRINRYFTDLREELDERRERAAAKSSQSTEDQSMQQFGSQREALDREEQAQITELRRKMNLSAQVRLLNVQIVVQPKLGARVRLIPQKGAAGEAVLVFDPVTQKPEAWTCPRCGRPTLSLALTSTGEVACGDCVQRENIQKRKR
jgi:hypothetical protein